MDYPPTQQLALYRPLCCVLCSVIGFFLVHKFITSSAKALTLCVCVWFCFLTELCCFCCMRGGLGRSFVCLFIWHTHKFKRWRRRRLLYFILVYYYCCCCCFYCITHPLHGCAIQCSREHQLIDEWLLRDQSVANVLDKEGEHLFSNFLPDRKRQGKIFIGNTENKKKTG